MPEDLKPISFGHVPQLASVDISNVEQNFESQEYALELVNRTYSIYSSWRSSNLDMKWGDADALMNGVVPVRTWPGSNIPKASYPQPIVSDQFRTILPSLEQSLFPDSEDWFELQPAMPQNLPAPVGRLITNTFKYYIDSACEIGEPSGRREIMTAIMDCLLYKLGAIHVYWDDSRKRPKIESVDIRDIFIDPKANVPSAEACRSIVWRKLLSVRDIKALRADKRFNIPADEVLYFLATNSPGAPADTSKNISYIMSGLNVQSGPTQYDQAIEDKEVEVLIYYSKDRVIWVFNRLWVAYNQATDYKFYPFCFVSAYALPHKAFGESLADLLKSTQRLSEGLMNNFVDSIHLSQIPPRVEKKQSGVTAGDQWYPGLKMTVQGEADKDIIFPQVPGPVTQVWDLIQWVANQGYSRTGNNPLQQGGIPTPSNANRTASGMQMQTSGGSNRLYSIIKLIEDYLLVPLLHKMTEYCRMNILDGEKVEGLNENGELTEIAHTTFQIPLKITVKCASRVISRDKMMQFLPNLIQYLLQGPFVGALHQIGQTIDVGELISALQDATGLGKKYQFTRALTQQEMQQMQQAQQPKPDPNKVFDHQSQMEQIKLKGQIDMQKEQVKNAPNPMEMQVEQMKAEMERQRDEAKIQMEYMKLEIMKQKAQLDMMTSINKANIDAQVQQMEANSERQRMEQEAQFRQNEQQMSMVHQMESHQVSMEQQKQMAAQKAAEGPKPSNGK